MNSEPNIQPVALSPKSFAARFSKSETWAYRLIYAGKLQTITGLGNVMIPLSEVDRLLSLATAEYTTCGRRGRKPKVQA